MKLQSLFSSQRAYIQEVKFAELSKYENYFGSSLVREPSSFVELVIKVPSYDLDHELLTNHMNNQMGTRLTLNTGVPINSVELKTPHDKLVFDQAYALGYSVGLAESVALPD